MDHHSLHGDIAKCALHHYDEILPPNKGKPKDTEWTVYAAIVAEEETDDDDDDDNNKESRFWVVSCATGTKCANFTAAINDGSDALLHAQTETTVLRDCHAEALARRGLMHVLWRELSDHHLKKNAKSGSQSTTKSLLLQAVHQEDESITNPQPNQKFDLRSTIRLHLYISDSPCGDAAIYPLLCSNKNDDEQSSNEKTPKEDPVLSFTGAKVIVSGQTGVQAEACGGNHQLLPSSSNAAIHNNTSIENTDRAITDKNNDTVQVAREDIQLLGKLRTKSGRSNLACHLRTSCMSCSDKLVRWSVLGLQGSLLSRLIPKPIRLTSIVVSQDPRASKPAQEEALCRATQQRAVATLEYLRTKLAVLSESNKTKEMQASYRHYLLDNNYAGPTIGIVSQKYRRGKSAAEFELQQQSQQQTSSKIQPDNNNSKKKLKRESSNNTSSSLSPCGISLTWNQSMTTTNSTVSVEMVVGARGLCQGKKPRELADYFTLASRLSRHAIYKLAHPALSSSQVNECKEQTACPATKKNEAEEEEVVPVRSPYRQLKDAWGDPTVNHLRSLAFSGGPLNGWLRS